MKKITILSAAVLVSLAAVSCLKETSGPENAGTVLRASLAPTTKTALGEKEGTSWPNYWQAGDRISVNGVTSVALGAEADGKSTASFSFEGTLEAPYCAVYPADAVSAFSDGNATFTVPATQHYVAGSYDPAALIMGGKSTEEGVIDLAPCVSLFHLSLTGEPTETISRIRLTAAPDAALSGSFSTDFTAITPETVSNTVELVAETPVELPADFFICIASGLTGALTVDIFDTGGGRMSKSATIHSALAAGRVYSPPALAYEASSAGDFEIVAEHITSSTAVICWDDPENAYTVKVYADAGCTSLVDSYSIDAGNACWGGSSPRFCISGLAPGTTYYVVVSDDTAGTQSTVLPVTTAAFTIKEMSDSEAAVGDVLLAEDFGELRWDCDVIGGGVGWFPTNEARATSFGTVEIESFQAVATSSEKTLSGETQPVSLSRLAHWGQGASPNLYVHPGYIKLVGSSRVTHLVTPALDNIPSGMKATVEVEVTACAYFSASSSSYATMNAVVAVQKADDAFNELAGGGTNTLNLTANVQPVTLTEEVAWHTYTVTLSDVSRGDRLAFGAAADVTGNNARMNISDMKVTLTALEEDSSVRFIRDDATFLDFVDAVAAGEKTLSAVLVPENGDELTLSAATVAAFESIEGFEGTFDGNGKTLIGLTKPLFATLSGTVKDLTLDSAVSASDVDDSDWGILAKTLSDGSVTGCTVRGSITYAPEAAPSDKTHLGGLVGNWEGGSISDCCNCADVTYNGEGTAQVFIGGVVSNNEVSGKTLSDCHSTAGTLTYDGATYGGNLYIGGVVGYSNRPVSGCTNVMTVTVGGAFTRTSNNFNAFGGIVGSMSANQPITDCLNTGDVACDQQISGSNGYTYVGGIAGRTQGNIADSSNGGTVTFSGKNDAQNPFIGGIVGDTPDSGSISVSGKHSSAPATNYGNVVVNTTTQSKKYLYVGGVVGRLRCAVTATNAGRIEVASLTCTSLYLGGVAGSGTTANASVGSGSANLAEGDITVSGLTSNQNSFIGGVAGHLENAACSITGCTNDGDVVLTDGSKASRSLFVGGVLGRAHCPVSDCTNNGTVSNAAPMVGGADYYMQIGGVVGYNNSGAPISNCHNTGEVTNTANSGSYLYVGGITSESDAAISGCDNTGPVSNSGNSGAGKWISVGGIVGQNSADITSSSNGTASENGGTVSNSGTAAEDVNLGGVVGCNSGKTLTSCFNKGAVTNSGNSNEGYNVSVGGLVGWSSANSVYVTCHNSGPVTNSGNGSNTGAPGARVGGLVASASGANTLSGSETEYNYNEGILLENSESLIAAVGGICGWANNASGDFNYCRNLEDGDITVAKGTYKYLYIGGILACADKTPSFSYTKNAGNITITGITLSEAAYIGGINGGFLANGTQTITGCENTGDITCENTGGNGGNMQATAIDNPDGKGVMTYIGGIAGVSGNGSAKTGKTFTNCINRGAISVYNQLPTRLGGCLGYANINPDGCENHGKIVYYRFDPKAWKNNGGVGGVVGYMNIETAANLTNTGGVQTTGSSPNCYTGGIIGHEGGNMTTMVGCKVGKSGINIVGAGAHAFGSTCAGLFVASKTAKEWTFTDCKVIIGTKCQGEPVTDENMAIAVVGRNHATATNGLPELVTSF